MNKYLGNSDQSGQNGEQSGEQTAAATGLDLTRIQDAFEKLQLRVEKLENSYEEVRERLDSLEGYTESLREEYESLGIESEAGEEFEERLENLHREIGDLGARVADLDGDLLCATCDQPITLEKVRNVQQESSGAFSSAGLVTAVECPVCESWHDVSELEESERERVTNRLRLDGVANGEVDPEKVAVRGPEDEQEAGEEGADA